MLEYPMLCFMCDKVSFTYEGLLLFISCFIHITVFFMLYTFIIVN